MTTFDNTTESSNHSITSTWTSTVTSEQRQLSTSATSLVATSAAPTTTSQYEVTSSVSHTTSEQNIVIIVVPIVVGVILIAVVILIVIYKKRGFRKRPRPLPLPPPDALDRTIIGQSASNDLPIGPDARIQMTNVDEVSHTQIQPIVFLTNANDTLRPAHKDHEVRTVNSIYQNSDNSPPSSATAYYNVQVPVPSHVMTEAATGNSKIHEYVNVTSSADVNVGQATAHSARSGARHHDYVNLNADVVPTVDPNTRSPLPVSAQNQNIYNNVSDLDDLPVTHPARRNP